jgi:hypothetical protein
VLASKAVLRKSISLTRPQPVIASSNPANNSREQSFVQKLTETGHGVNP